MCQANFDCRSEDGKKLFGKVSPVSVAPFFAKGGSSDREKEGGEDQVSRL